MQKNYEGPRWKKSCFAIYINLIEKWKTIEQPYQQYFQTHTIQVAIEWRRPFMNRKGKLSFKYFHGRPRKIIPSKTTLSFNGKIVLTSQTLKRISIS